MTIKQKFERIDQSKLEPKQVDALKIVLDFTENFKTKDKEKIKITNEKLDNIIAKLQEKNPDAVKPIPSAKTSTKKVVKPKTPKRNIFSVAKEIKKVGETFEEAKVRASKMIKEEKEEANKTIKTEMQSLLEYIKEHKELQGIHGTDLGRDASRVAKIGGRRISKDGNVYYENRENRKDRLAPNYPKNAPLLAKGGTLPSEYVQVVRWADGNYRVEKKTISDDFAHTFNDVFEDLSKAENFAKKISVNNKIKYIGVNTIPYDFVKGNKMSNGGGVGNKKYTIEHNIGKSKYVVSYHDGVKKHKDGSDFYDIQIFKNKKDLETFTSKLSNEGYNKFANGGEFMTDPTFGNFQNQVYAKGGLLKPMERYILEIKGLTGLRVTAIENYIEENELSNDDVLNIVIGLGRKQLKGSDVATAVVGKKGNSESKKLISFAKNNEGMKMAKGGDLKGFSDNQLMVMNQNVQLEHHHEELEDILEDKTEVPAWVVAKMATATESISDVTHYLDGEKELLEEENEENEEGEEKEGEEEENEDEVTVEPISVSTGTKSNLAKDFSEDALGNLKGFLKGKEGIELEDDYTFSYKGKNFEIEPVINSDEKGVSNALFTVYNDDEDQVGEIVYTRGGGKQNFIANSKFFKWNDVKFANGGSLPFMTDPSFGNFQSGVYAKGGEIAKAEILGLSKNIMGTTDIEMKITGMRKPQSFIVYPISKDDSGDIITIQSETRIGKIDLPTGRGLMSQSHSNGAYFIHLQMDKKTPFILSDNDLKDLKEHIIKTSGASVGTRGVLTDNSGASKVFAIGGSIDNSISSQKNWNENQVRMYDVYAKHQDDIIDLKEELGRAKLRKDTSLVKKLTATINSKKQSVDYIEKNFNKFELGGVMVTDLAGHTGGALGTGDPTLLSGYSGTYYGGLTGETGAMSAGEMFELGGTLGDPAILNAYSGTRYTGLVAETGALSSGEMFENGGGIRTPDMEKRNKLVNSLTKEQLIHYLSQNWGYRGFDGKAVTRDPKKRDIKNLRIEVLRQMEYDDKHGVYEMGGGLPDGVQQSYVNYYLGATGVLAEGGSLEAHGIEEGDTFIKTISGNIQKVKDKDGNIVFINLATGERDSQPPLPFKKGGSIDHKYLNHSQDYEVRYAKGKNRHGYGHIEYAEGGNVEFSEKRKEYLENLSDLEAEVWDKIGADSGAQIRNDKTLLKKYAEGVSKVMETEGVGYGSFDQQDYDFYTDQNSHLFNEFLVWNNYYEPEMTKVEKAWRKKAFEKDPKHNYISNPEVITLNSTKRANEQEASSPSFKPTVKFNVGDVVWQKDEKRYGVVMDNYDNPIDGDLGEIRLDSTGNTNIFEYDKNYENTGYNLVKFGSSEDAGNGDIQDIKDSANRLIKSQIEQKNKEKEKYYREIFKRVLAGEFDNSSKPIAKLIPNLKKHYVPHYEIKSVKVKKGGKEVTYDAKDVLNGANMLKGGGELEKSASYISKNNVVHVELKDGTHIKPSNGYWIKKGAMPIDKMEDGGKIEEAVINKDGIKVKSVAEPKKKLTEAEWLAKHSEAKEARSYKAGGNLSKYSQFIQDEFPASKRLANKFAKKYNLPFLVLVEKDNDDSIYVKEANGFYAFPKSYIDAHDVLYVTTDKMAFGGFFGKKDDTAVKKEKVKDFTGQQVVTSDGVMVTVLAQYADSALVKDLGNEYKDSYKIDLKKLQTPENMKMANGGKVTFKEKSKAIAKKFVGKRVEPKYQKEYGKVYSKEEAGEVGNKIAGKMVAGEKMKRGGIANRGGIMLLAKQIREEGESWKDALKRAGDELRK